MKKKEKTLLKQLIKEQNIELEKEKKLVRYSGGNYRHKKGGRGIFVGNKIF